MNRRNGDGISMRRTGLFLLGSVCLLIAGCSASTGSPPEAPTNLRVCDVENPVGTGADPSFGWYVNDPDSNEIQTAYQILVVSSETLLSDDQGDVWDSGKVESRRQNHIPLSDAQLESDRKYYWKVRTWDTDGQAGAWSAPASFTVGLLQNEAWAGANWIRRDTRDADDYTYYRKSVDLPAKPIERATVYVTSVHKYELYLNGELVGKGPAYHYPQYQYYNAYDISDLMTAGVANQFALFNHWFGGGQGRAVSARGVIMKAVVHYADGSETVVGTDGSWLQSRAEAWSLEDLAQYNSGEGVGYIERIDGRKLIPDWYTSGFDDSAWESATVIGPHPVAPWTGRLAPDLTRIEETVIKPVSIEELSSGTFMVDLGKVYAGVPRIRFSGGEAGTVVQMAAGYALDDAGEIDSSQNQSTDMSYRTMLSGDTYVYQPVEYLGMRYFQIDNAPMPVTNDNFSFVERHSAMDEKSSSFESSDDTLNAVWDLMKHSLLTCAQEEFVDTPTREKGGFLGDAAIQSTVAMPVFNERLLTRRVLNEFLQSMDQHWSGPGRRGRINAVYPNRDGARDIPDYTQAYLIWVWDYYMATGDRQFLAANYSKFKDVTDYVTRYRNAETGLITNLEGGSGAYQYGIVDWPSEMRFGYEMTAARTVINGWAYADFVTMAKIARELGNRADVEIYQQRAVSLKRAINEQLINESGEYVDGLKADGSQSTHVSQHANIFPFALHIVPESSHQRVIDEIKEQQMSVGMVTLPWLIRALGEADEGEHLMELFTNEEWNGWAQCLVRGATCTWESWDADTAGNSLSHAWGASGLEGYVRYILGIKPLTPQYEIVQIQPLDFGNSLDWAGGSITTDRGRITVQWKRTSQQYEIKLTIPDNVTARVAIPKGGTDDVSVLLDGDAVDAVPEGAYLVVAHVGSGEHALVRRDQL